MSVLKKIFKFGNNSELKNKNKKEETDLKDPQPVLAKEHEEYREVDLSILQDQDGTKEEKLYQEATREAQSAAEYSLKKLHVLRLGRCPSCGEHLRRHLFASICENCGWHSFEMPKNGAVHLYMHDGQVLKGDQCYFVKDSSVLLVKNDLVIAKVPTTAYERIEYHWSELEINQRHRQVADRMVLSCGWCGEKAEPEEEGFHLVHVAFGTSQERYCFCSDDCYESFRKMYPSRVHRNCYDRDCTECDLCVKRYSDGVEGMHMLAKDYLTVFLKSK